MTEQIIAQVAQHILDSNDWLKDLKYIARQLQGGRIMLKKDHEVGLDDRNGNIGYIRWRGDEDHTYRELETKFTSCAEGWEAVANLRLVVMLKCTNAGLAEFKLVNDLKAAPITEIDGFKPDIIVLNSTTDRELIEREETGKEDDGPRSWNNEYKLISIDFEVQYGAVPGIDCINFNCNEC
jgi:hypothetical protein